MNCGKNSVNIGDYVVYKKRGVYLVADIRREKIGSELKDYYALRSVYDERATVCVPADNDALVSQMEAPLTKAQIDEIILNSRNAEVEWKTSASGRRMYGEEIVSSGDLSVIISLYVLYVSKRRDAILNKGKFFAHDERMIGACKKVLCELFAFPLELKKDEVIPYIEGKLAVEN